MNSIILDSSDIFSIFSKINQQEYRIQIRFPMSYETKPEKSYPVIIKIDGQWDFLLATSIYNCIYFDGQMPEAIFIGIDWGEVEGDIHQIRSRDLSPVPMEGYPGSGHAQSFTRVISDEIFPELEKRFRLNGERILLGGSMGAVFTTYALLERPDFFDGAIAIAGGYGESKDFLKEKIDSLSSSDTLNGKSLYFGVGSFDSAAPLVEEMAKKIEEAKIKGLAFQLDKQKGFGHSGMNVAGYAGGYQFVFKRPNLALPQETFKKHTGEYRAEDPDSDQLSVRVNDRTLEVTDSFGCYLLQARDEKNFYHPGILLNLRFEGDRVFVERFGEERTYRRI